MSLAEVLDITPGVTSVIGSGGKTSLLTALARELPGTVVLTTTTHILPFEGMRLPVSPTAADVAHANQAEIAQIGRAPCRERV